MKVYLTPEDKDKYLQQLQAHYNADEIIKGQYWEDGKGCAVGCLLHSSDHSQFEKLGLIPEWLGRLLDKIFEGLPNEEAKEFPLQFWKALPSQKTSDFWDGIKRKFHIFILDENIERVEKLDLDNDLKTKILSAIRQCRELQVLPSNEAARSAAYSAARSAARSAAESVSRSAAYSAWSVAYSAGSVAYSAESAAESVAYSAESAAYSAGSVAYSAESAAWSVAYSAGSVAYSAESVAESAESAAYQRYRDELLRLIESQG